MNDKKIKMLGEAPVTTVIIKMSIPVVMGMMVQVLYNLVDTYFIGKLNDSNQLAAANLTMPLFMIIMATSGIIGTGGASYISRCLGEKNYEEANHTLSAGFSICIGLGVIVTVLGLTLLSPLINSLGVSPQTFPYATDYSAVLLIGSIFIMCNFTLGQLLRSEGAAIASITGMMLGTVINIILDPVFILLLNMGIRGAAIATVLGNAVAFAFYIYFYLSGKSFVKLNIKKAGFDKKIWGQIFGIGTPATISQLLMSVAIIICNNLAAAYGDTVIAGMGVASKILTIGTFIFIGFAGGCQPIVGYNYGAKNFKRVSEVIKKGITITASIGIVLAFVFSILASQLISTFTSLPEIIDIGAVILRAYIFALPIIGTQLIATTTVQAIGKGLAALFLSISRQGLFYIPILFFLNNVFGFNGLIHAQPISDAFSVTVSVTVLAILLKNSKKAYELEKNKEEMAENLA